MIHYLVRYPNLTPHFVLMLFLISSIVRLVLALHTFGFGLLSNPRKYCSMKGRSFLETEDMTWTDNDESQNEAKPKYVVVKDASDEWQVKEDEVENEDLDLYFCVRILFMSFKCFPPILACMMSRYCCKQKSNWLHYHWIFFCCHIFVSPCQSNQKTNTIMFLGQTLNRWKTEIFTKLKAQSYIFIHSGIPNFQM